MIFSLLVNGTCEMVVVMFYNANMIWSNYKKLLKCYEIL